MDVLPIYLVADMVRSLGAWNLAGTLFVLGQFAGFGDNFFKVNLQSHGDSQQGVQGWDAQFLFDKPHCLARQSGFLGNQIERKPVFCPFLFQKTGDLRANGFGYFIDRHAKAIHEKRLTNDATIVALCRSDKIQNGNKGIL